MEENFMDYYAEWANDFIWTKEFKEQCEKDSKNEIKKPLWSINVKDDDEIPF